MSTFLDKSIFLITLFSKIHDQRNSVTKLTLTRYIEEFLNMYFCDYFLFYHPDYSRFELEICLLEEFREN